METAFHENILTKKLSEEVVRKFIDDIQKDKHGQGVQGVSDKPQGNTAIAAAAPASSTAPTCSVPTASPTGPTVRTLHIRILVDRMDCERPIDRDQEILAGAVTEESMLKVLQEFSHDQVFEEDLRVFQESVRSIISGTLGGSMSFKDRWVDPDKKTQYEAIKPVGVHKSGCALERSLVASQARSFVA